LPGAEEWQLVIAGWEQGGHQAELENQAREMAVADSVHFVGPQFDLAKAASFQRADAFVLPSFSEGLPMAVLEAWSYARPVLMTPQCNLPEGFAAGAAMRIEPQVASVVSGLGALFRMPDHERIAMGQRGRDLVARQFTWSRIGAEMANVYRWVLGQGPQPDCVRTD
jgi:glycosyltransferase involved in cell wall biosynthesis